MNVLSCAAPLAAFAALASLRWNWWRREVDGVPVLMYHKFGSAPPDAKFPQIWATGAEFARQLEHLKSRGYETMTLAGLRDAELGRAPMPRKPLLITIDDGYANVHEVAFPILKRFGMKANVFLVLGSMGGDSSFDAKLETAPAIPMLSWAQVKEMQASGLVEFGSHSTTHRELTSLPLEEARAEIAGSKTALEKALGREVLGFVYPRGQGGDVPAIRALVLEAGYRYDFSTLKGITPRPWNREREALKRVEPVGGISLLDFHLLVTRGRARITRRFWE